MPNAIFKVPETVNEPLLSYLPGSSERAELKAKLAELKTKKLEIPLIIGGKEVKTDNLGQSVMPHNHQHVLADYHKASAPEVNQAIDAALDAREAWAEMDWADRASIFLKAADLLAGPWRATINAATMLDMSKNAWQAEIDAAAELADFYRFNVKYLTEIYQEQPYSPRGVWNRVEYRPLEGFVFAVTPFNFLSIAGNLPTAPAMAGNVALWKPASSAVFAAYHLAQMYKDAGLPDGVVNFIPGSGAAVGDPALASPHLAGIHFTGSTEVFQGMWKTIGENITKYKTYPRIVGETGGKNFVFAHNSANIDELVTGILRASYEFSGQKCSASSRSYIPDSLWSDFKAKLVQELAQIKVGDPEDFTTFMNAVIDASAFKTITGYIDYAKESSDAEIIFGGSYDDSTGYFIDPTVVKTTNPNHKLMVEEIFGPVMTMYVYPDSEYVETLKLCDQTSPYALTGAIFAKDKKAMILASKILQNASGNVYYNDKPTGAVVGQQPFGGARASGTNDKAGSKVNLLRWISQRTIKENFVPPKEFKYPYMSEP